VGVISETENHLFGIASMMLEVSCGVCHVVRRVWVIVWVCFVFESALSLGLLIAQLAKLNMTNMKWYSYYIHKTYHFQNSLCLHDFSSYLFLARMHHKSHYYFYFFHPNANT
jgi:hypothetical protein